MRFCNFHMSEKWHVFYSSMIIWAGTHLGTLLSLHRGALQSSLGVPGPGCAIEAHMDDIWPFSQHALSVWHLQSCWMWQIGGWNIPRIMAYTINMIQRHPWSWTWFLNGWVTCSPRHGTPLYSPTQFSSHFHQLSSNTQLPITNQVLKPSISSQWTLSAVTTLNSHQQSPH
jgi:hypothetical protein